ncbi:G2/mitotic-specific cyclin S13-6 [Erysiphe neolycopersici]|uniref:G2/mitotic-specific cyclin S13-6 n=1 Tax=Erysiphe neolycopersici TaxID=212602 RepID=A0A420I0V9_9PEZI|nr:G2/mitotic-specific cyclin S13-6 [Erysiphe neolycopersici]
MDARPQRPIRSMRAHKDENCAPTLYNKQYLHLQQKSANSMATLGVGGLKATAKRTVFGDVSNTAKNLSNSNDDFRRTHGDFKGNELKEKPSTLKPVKKHFAVAATKISKSNSKLSSEINDHVSISKAALPHSHVPLRRTSSMRNTSVYKDLDTKNKNCAHNQSYRFDSTQSTAPSQYGSRSHQKESQACSALIQSGYDQNSLYVPDPSKKNPDSRDTVEEHYVKQVVPSNEVFHTARKKQSEETICVEMNQIDSDGDLVQDQVDLPCLPSLMSESESEDEEEESYYDQGHLTVNSYRSCGDNTTNGVTTTLYPKVTNKVKQELESAKKFTEEARTIEDIGDEIWDTSMVAEYSDEIFAYMRELEIKMLPNAHYMDLQTEIQWSMRSVLMDWLIQVHHRFSLLPETLFLCVNYVDRFLSCKIVSLGKLQLVGATAIFVAAKYEEINCPSVDEIVYMVDGGYTVDEILKAERFMLNMLQFELGWPGPMSFLRRVSKADEYDLETRTLAKYFLEVTIMDERFVGSPPSYIAAGSHCLARLLLRKGNWTKQHVHYSGYTWTQLRPLVAMIKECCEFPQKHHNAVFEKYSDRKFKRAAQFVLSEIGNFTLPSSQPSQPSLPAVDCLSVQNPHTRQEPLRPLVKS